MKLTPTGSLSDWLADFSDAEYVEPFKRSLPYAQASDMDELMIANNDEIAGAMKELPFDELRTQNENIEKDKARESHEPVINMSGQQKRRAIPSASKNRITKVLHGLGTTHHDAIPLSTMFEALEVEGVIPVQEDGTRWSGLLVGGAECGSDAARDQVAHFDLAVRLPDFSYAPATVMMHLSWCKMPSGKYEVVAYLGQEN